jgi:hypothetical protein
MENATETELRQKLASLQKSRLQAARRCAISFGIISILALLAFVFGYVQLQKGRETAELAELASKERNEALMMRDRAEMMTHKAQLAMQKLEQLTIELEICKASKK